MPPASATLCVHCHKAPIAPEWRPLCCQRCKLQDLARWVDGGFRIAGDPVSDDPDDGEPSPTEP